MPSFIPAHDFVALVDVPKELFIANGGDDSVISAGAMISLGAAAGDATFCWMGELFCRDEEDDGNDMGGSVMPEQAGHVWTTAGKERGVERDGGGEGQIVYSVLENAREFIGEYVRLRQ